MNNVIYPLLRKYRIHWGPISRITTGFAMCTIGSMGFAILQYYVYQTSPCGNQASTCSDLVPDGAPSVSPISIGYYAIPIIITALSEVLCNVTAYSIAYSQSPKNMKGVVSALNLFMTAISSAIALGAAPAIQDPYLIWAFAGPTIAGAVCTVVFWFMFKDIDKEEFYLNTDVIEKKSEETDEEAVIVGDEKKAELKA
jgi:dipeptide/tripeptide permease